MIRRRLAGAAGAAALAALALPLGATAHAATATQPGTYAAYCSAATATAFTGCYVDGATTPLSVPAGSSVTTDPSLPSTAIGTSGLTAPDGILGVIPAAKAPAGVPAGATTILYVDKQVSYFTPGAVASTVTLPVSNATIPVTGNYSTFGAGTYYLGGNTTNTIESVTCTGATTTSLTGCTSVGSTADSVKAGNSVGAPGSCVTSSAVLGTIGEGSAKPKTLFKNNEDYAAVRMAYTTDGRTFTDITPAAGIGLGNPTEQTNLRWVSPGGSVVTNPDGTLGLFYSGGVCSDGDSDAFGSVYYSTSTDGGLTWSTPAQVTDTGSANNSKLSTDYSFAASIANQGSTNPLDISAYYEGRIYSPSVVQNADGSLTMTFAGYRTSKPLPATGPGATAIGRAPGGTGPASKQYTPAATDPALYRNILTVQLSAVAGSSPTSYTAATPVVAQVENGPWTLSQGDAAQAPYAPNGGSGSSYTTYTPGGSPTNTIGGTTYPNLSTYPGPGTSGTSVPYTTAYAGVPGPLAGYCSLDTYPTTAAQQTAAETATVNRQPAGTFEPMSPYYFPHIDLNADGTLTGYFDYRPKDSDEATVVATSSDKGATWQFQTEALELSQNHCPWGNADAALQTTPTTVRVTRST